MRLPFRIVQLWWLGFTSPHNGFALVQTHGKPNEAPAELWGTTDGGATWREVPIR